MDEPALKSRVYGRGTDLDTVQTSEEYQAREQARQRREQLDGFVQAVRSKERWFFKILDGRDLGAKWAVEAQLDKGPDLDVTIQELKEEARRICIFDHAIRLASPGLPEREVDFVSITASVHNVVAYLRAAKHGIDQPKLFEHVGVCTVDNEVPKELHTELGCELDRLAAMKPKDFHPGSGCKVQDLIHPSLYPYMAHETPLPPTIAMPRTEDGKFKTTLRGTHPSHDDSYNLVSSFAWIPTVFAVSEDGQSVSIDGYINGLGSRTQYPLVYKLLEQTFSVVMPLLERTVAHHFVVKPTPAHLRWEERSSRSVWEDITREEWNAIRAKSDERRAAEDAQTAEAEEQQRKDKAEERARFASAPPAQIAAASAWAGRGLKVIVKAATYILQLGQEYTGSWHIEGMPHERIVASAIYYYDRDDGIEDAGLYLRRKRDDEDFPNPENDRRDMFNVDLKEPEDDDGSPEDDDDYRVNDAPSDYGGSDVYMGDLNGYINVGIVPTTGPEPHATGRIVTFPNWIQHRVMKVTNTSADKVATRKILCFFLVDDNNESMADGRIDYHGFRYEGLTGMHVLSSVDVPSQRTRGGRSLPVELADIIVGTALAGGGLGITREEAEIRRRALMADRRVGGVGVNKVWEERFSLCEH